MCGLQGADPGLELPSPRPDLLHWVGLDSGKEVGSGEEGTRKELDRIGEGPASKERRWTWHEGHTRYTGGGPGWDSGCRVELSGRPGSQGDLVSVGWGDKGENLGTAPCGEGGPFRGPLKPRV
jgi:hypothetical protein